nr:hypothetical protein [Candidatus Njordarchaeota archaeon]
MLDLESFRRDVENFCSEVNLEYYLNWSGLKEELNVSKIFDKYSRLFDRGNIEKIRELRSKEKAGGEGERRLRYLQASTTEELLSHHVKEYTDKAETLESKELVKVDDEEIPFRLAEVRYHNEDDRTKRARIFHARDKAIEGKLNPILEERMEKLHSMSKDLGYRNYLELYRDTKKINFEELSNSMTYFIERTESMFVDKMGETTKKVAKLELSEAEKHDIAYVFRAKEFDSYFRKDKAIHVLESTLNGIGFDIAKNRNILIDVEERPRKSPRAFTATVKIPEDVRLVVMPKGGQDDYASMLHEAGHTIHHASVEKSLPIEYKRLGDSSVTETYAFLFEYLTLNKKWLNENIMDKGLNKYLDFAYLYKLYFSRRYGAKLKYELHLHAGRQLKGMADEYKETLEASLKFKHPRAHYLTDVDDGFYVAQYLRAWIFEAQLRAKITAKYGETWFKNPEAGRLLRDLWSTGQKYDAVELAQRIGYKKLDVTPMLKEFEEYFT